MLSPLPSFFFNERRPRVSAKRSDTSIIITPDTQGGTTRSNFEIFKKKRKKIRRFLLKFTAISATVFPTCPSNPSNYLSFRVSLVAQLYFFLFFFLSLSLSFPSPHPLTTYHSLLRVFVFIFFPEFSSDVHASNIPHSRIYIYTKPFWNVKNDSISKIANLITNLITNRGVLILPIPNDYTNLHNDNR